MHAGIMIEGQDGLTWERWFALADAAESMGYHSLCRSDHLTSVAGFPERPSLETWTSLTALATRTRRIRFGPVVSPITFYQPTVLAKIAAALDTLSGGRLDLGIGAGWNENEHATFGIALPPMKERMDRFECAARHIRALEAGEPRSLEQAYYPLRDAQLRPLPSAGRLRIVVGGRGEKRTLRIAAEVADEWNATRVDVDTFRHKQAVLARHCEAIGRDPSTIARSLMVPIAIGRDASEVAARVAAARAYFPGLPPDAAGWKAAGFLAGTPGELVDVLGRWGEAGLDRVLLQLLDQEDLTSVELFATRVMGEIA
ncbi:MAG: TIGR03560 family F420-dependent LLM class oxidoreductase [Ectothiorhodospiraceae bacterium]|nr:TIGR03560 family F420-dependent LLM class oxidoreductase [Chromatiales bacterium]MCP5154842.1 TIGR03560 family F420-dependent LLM class oxidoreductase [Ectothiorhodospiraceae bacterium]